MKKNLLSLICVLFLASGIISAADLGYINVKTYNATGDGTTNDLTAINSAIAACVILKNQGEAPVLYFPPAVSYCVNTQVAVPSGIHVRMDAPVKYTGTSDITVLAIGDSNISFWMDHKLSSIRANSSAYTSENNIAIQVKNCNSSRITISQATRSTIGVQFIGDGGGFAYNKIVLGYLSDNKIAVDLTNSNSGYINENNFLKGRFNLSSSQSGLSNAYGIRIGSKDESYVNNNNNLFIHPSFELNSTAVPVLIDHGCYNEVIGARSESNSSVFAQIENDSAMNAFNIGFMAGSSGKIVEENGTYDSSTLTTRGTPLTARASVVFDSGNLADKACFYDSTKVNIPGVHLAYPSNANIYKSQNYINIYNTYVEFTYGGIGIFVDTGVNKEFTVQRTAYNGDGGRIGIRCYDVNGNILTSSDTNHPYTKSRIQSSTISYISNYGGIYRTGSDNTDSISFVVHEDVKKIAVLLVNGSSYLKLKSFKIICSEATTAWTGYEEIIPGVNLGTQAPTSGTWTKGRVILNDNKTELGSAGSKYVIDAWECITSGTPGTWVQKRALTGN